MRLKIPSKYILKITYTNIHTQRESNIQNLLR